jgi:hypothetical protein
MFASARPRIARQGSIDAAEGGLGNCRFRRRGRSDRWTAARSTVTSYAQSSTLMVCGLHAVLCELVRGVADESDLDPKCTTPDRDALDARNSPRGPSPVGVLLPDRAGCALTIGSAWPKAPSLRRRWAPCLTDTFGVGRVWAATIGVEVPKVDQFKNRHHQGSQQQRVAPMCSDKRRIYRPSFQRSRDGKSERFDLERGQLMLRDASSLGKPLPRPGYKMHR